MRSRCRRPRPWLSMEPEVVRVTNDHTMVSLVEFRTFTLTCSYNVSFTGDPFEDIECNINAEYIIACKKQGSEVYLPFSFIQKYFEVYGYVSQQSGSGGTVRFEWSHSHGKINKPRGNYNPRGIFMYFDNYNVEVSFLRKDLIKQNSIVFFYRCEIV